MHALLENARNTIWGGKNEAVSYETAINIALLPPEHTIDIIALAGKIRSEFKTNRVFTCGITNAKSGLCSQDCAFCAQSAHHKTDLYEYPLLSADELLRRAVDMEKNGATHFSFVTSGYKLSQTEIDTICRCAEEIKKKGRLTLCASIGMLDEKSARQLVASGISKYHHNLETAESFFGEICTTHAYAEDIAAITDAKAAGLKICSGGIMGLGESWEQRVELAFTLRDLDVFSIPINFLNPISGTKMENRALLSPMEALKCIALFRIIHPIKGITICGGREVTLKDFQSWVFLAGANGLMIGNYLTTKGRDIHMDIEMIRDMGCCITGD